MACLESFFRPLQLLRLFSGFVSSKSDLNQLHPLQSVSFLLRLLVDVVVSIKHDYLMIPCAQCVRLWLYFYFSLEWGQTLINFWLNFVYFIVFVQREFGFGICSVVGCTVPNLWIP